MKIKLSSPPNTPKEEKLFVIEYPAVSRVKMSYKDVLSELASIDHDLTHKASRKKELEDIKGQMDKLL